MTPFTIGAASDCATPQSTDDDEDEEDTLSTHAADEEAKDEEAILSTYEDLRRLRASEVAMKNEIEMMGGQLATAEIVAAQKAAAQAEEVEGLETALADAKKQMEEQKAALAERDRSVEAAVGTYAQVGVLQKEVEMLREALEQSRAELGETQRVGLEASSTARAEIEQAQMEAQRAMAEVVEQQRVYTLLIQELGTVNDTLKEAECDIARLKDELQSAYELQLRAQAGCDQRSAPCATLAGEAEKTAVKAHAPCGTLLDTSGQNNALPSQSKAHMCYRCREAFTLSARSTPVQKRTGTKNTKVGLRTGPPTPKPKVPPLPIHRICIQAPGEQDERMATSQRGSTTSTRRLNVQLDGTVNKVLPKVPSLNLSTVQLSSNGVATRPSGSKSARELRSKITPTAAAAAHVGLGNKRRPASTIATPRKRAQPRGSQDVARGAQPAPQEAPSTGPRLESSIASPRILSSFHHTESAAGGVSLCTPEVECGLKAEASWERLSKPSPRRLTAKLDKDALYKTPWR